MAPLRLAVVTFIDVEGKVEGLGVPLSKGRVPIVVAFFFGLFIKAGKCDDMYRKGLMEMGGLGWGG